MTKFTKSEKMVVAALFARSNMGMRRPDVEVVRRLLAPPVVTHLSTPVEVLCGEFMESNADEDTFMAEARMWLRDKELGSLDSIRKIWPDMAELITSAMT